MLNFRYHVVSLVAVFMALATGIALGGGPLQGVIDTSLAQALADRKHQVEDLTTQNTAVLSERNFDDQVITFTSRNLLKRRLNRQRVALIAMPEVTNQLRQFVIGKLRASGAKISADLTVSQPTLTADFDQNTKAAINRIAPNLAATMDGDYESQQALGALLQPILRSPTANKSRLKKIFRQGLLANS